MSGRILKLEVPEHQAVQELLPWHAAGRLEQDEAERVARHVQGCAQCRQDLQWERELLDGIRCETPPEEDAEGALARLLPRLGGQESAMRPAVAGLADDARDAAGTAKRWWQVPAANERSWLRWAAVAQCVIIAGLALLLARPDADNGAYHALGASGVASTVAGAAAGGADPGITGAGGNAVVIFAPGTTEQDLRHILQAQDARIIDGPTVAGAYILSIPAASRDQALHALRGNAAVSLVEPMDSGAAP